MKNDFDTRMDKLGRGIRHPIRTARYIINLKMPISLRYIINLNPVFKFNGLEYRYFYGVYNFTWENERQVELSIIKRECDIAKGKRILEVGNVLSHYFSIKHDILDKYEVADGVINEDVVSFKSKRGYDLIVSISTLEHVGWDEKPREHMKFIKAIDNLKKNLAEKGKIILTVPVGQNDELDWLLSHKRIKFSDVHYLKRVSKDRWVEMGWDEIKQTRNNYPYPYANAIVVGTIEKSLPTLSAADAPLMYAEYKSKK